MIVIWLNELLDACAGVAAGARMEALHHQVLADAGFLDDQVINIQIVVVLGIGDGRLQRLLHHPRNAMRLGEKCQHVQGRF